MSDHDGIRLSRREFLGLAGMASAAGVLSACQAQATPTSVPPTAVPPTSVPPTAVPPTVAPVDKWAIYPDDDPRHWSLSKVINPPKRYDGLVITQALDTGGNEYIAGESAEDNVYSRWLKKEMGVYYDPVWAGWDFNTSFWPTILAGGDMPELMVAMGRDQYPQLREADKLADIKDIWEATASDLTKKKKHYPDGPWWQFVTENGHIYGIPRIGGGGFHVQDDILWVRQDWLDKVGLPFPDTLDQVYETAKAFLAAGLGKYGIFAGWQFAHSQYSMSSIFGAYGCMPMAWRRGSDGKLSWGSLDVACKEALAVLAKWFKGGILSPEFLAIKDYGKELAGGVTGIALGPDWWSGEPLSYTKETDPNFNWAPGPIPAGPGGKRGRYASDQYLAVGNMNAFAKGTDPIKIECYINQLNWFYEIEDASESGISWNPLLFEGYDYEVVDGVAQYGTALTWRWGPGAFDYFGRSYPEIDMGPLAKLAELFKADPKTLNPLQALAVSDESQKVFLAAYKVTWDMAPFGIPDDYIWAIPPDLVALKVTLDTFEADSWTKIVTGADPVSAWDKFAADWMAMGGDKLTAAVNAEDAKHK